MKRREFLTTATLVAASATVAAPAIAQTPTIRWRMATSWPKSLDTIYGSAAAMCQRIGKLTDGKFEIAPFAGGEIVGGTQVLDAVQQNTVECGHTLSSFYFGKNPVYAIDSGLAFGGNMRQQSAWMYSGGGLELLRDFYRREGSVNFPCGNT